jgi:hypothetical protein
VALYTNSTGQYNVALGSQALYSNTTASNNTAVGYQALYNNTTGAPNTAIGYQALYANTTAGRNTAVGYVAGQNNTTGHITAIGAYVLVANTTGTGNTGVGGNDETVSGALQSNTIGSYNIAVGTGALNNNTTANNNTAVGYQALSNNTTASNNTAVGYQALYTTAGGNGTTAANNTALGYQAGYLNSLGYTDVFIGYQAGYNNGTGVNNVFVGSQAGYSVSGASNNTFLGNTAGYAVTSGAKNTIIGQYNGNQGGLDIRTASNYIVLSDGDGNPRAWIGAGNNNDLFRVGTTSTSTSGWMHQISYSQTSRGVLGITNDVAGGNPSGVNISYPNSSDTSSTNSYLYCQNSVGVRVNLKNDGGINNYSGNNSNLSDRREKKDFEPSKLYLETICAIPVQTFNYIDQSDDIKTLGVVAQDVQEVAPELVHESNWGTEENPRIRLSVYQTDLQFALMKSIQELKTIVDAQSAEIAELKAKVM